MSKSTPTAVTQVMTRTSGPYEAHALRFCSVYLSFVKIYSVTDAAGILKKVAAAFAQAKRTALLALSEQEKGLEITLGPGQRHLHPNRFNDLGYHRLLVDDNLLQQMHKREPGTYGAELEEYINDCACNPSQRGIKIEDMEDEEQEDEEMSKKPKARKQPPKKKSVAQETPEEAEAEHEESIQQEEDVPPPPAVNISVGKTLRAIIADQVEKRTTAKPPSTKRGAKSTDEDEPAKKKRRKKT